MRRWATVKGSSREIVGGQAVKTNIRRSNILTCHAADGPPGLSTANSSAVSGPPGPIGAAIYGPPVAAVDTVPIGVIPPCSVHVATCWSRSRQFGGHGFCKRGVWSQKLTFARDHFI